jgi:flavin-dependent dehydrogenase
LKTIAIIGGGPAGALAAERLARGRIEGFRPQSGWTPRAPLRGRRYDAQPLFELPLRPAIRPETRIVVFEEKLGWEKPCGGGLPCKALQRYPFLREASEPHTLIHQIELAAASGASVRFRLREPIAVYSRAILNACLLGRAERAGADVIEDRVLRFGRSNGGWSIEGRSQTYKADFLVLAAGACTRLRAPLAPQFTAQDFMLTFGYYAPGTDSLLRVQFFDDFEGYAWSFPRPDHLSLGICGKAVENKMPELRARLAAFMKRFNYSSGSNASKGHAPVFSQLLPALSVEGWHSLQLAGPGWAFAGDTAGLVDPVTGEGIYFAMRSGELLAESLLAGIPETYPARVSQEFGRKLGAGARLARLFYREEFLGQPSTTRLVQFAGCSRAFMSLLESLVEGSESYLGLVSRVYKTFGRSFLELAAGALREEFRPGGSARRAHDVN